MFGIGFLEICIIALVAIVVVGPQKLPEMMRHVGRFFVQARKMSNEVKSTFETVIKDAEQELHLEKLEKIRNLTKENITNALLDYTHSTDPVESNQSVKDPSEASADVVVDSGSSRDPALASSTPTESMPLQIDPSQIDHPDDFGSSK